MALSDYEDALKSYIHDDDKLATYKWLSKEFEIHVNTAKDILKEYWEKYKDEEKIVATYLLMGQLNDRSIRVEVVKDSDLNKAKAKYAKIDCEHLYSLQKSLEDVELLATTGKGDLRFSGIKCDENLLQIEEFNEAKSSRCNEANSAQNEKEIDANENIKSKAEVDKKNSKESDKTEKKEEIKNNSELKAETTKKKISPTGKTSNAKGNKKPVQSVQSGFNSLFGKAASNKVQKPTAQENNDDKNKKQNIESKEKKVESKLKENKKEEEKINGKNNHEKENRNEQPLEKAKDSKIENKVNSKSNTKVNKDTRGKKRNRSKDNGNASKRKRVVIADSSEDESNRSEDEEVEEPMETEEEPPKIVRKRTPSPPAEKRENGKRMVRKTIDKTFHDADGYLVTKKVHVYEAVSDNDEPEEVKKPEAPKPKAEEIKSKKQTSLMSFFKKS